MTLNPIALSFMFGNFSPSDRRVLLEHLQSRGGEDVYIEALSIYLDGWAKADWLEAYSVEIIGEWTANKASPRVKSAIRKLITSKLRSKKPNTQATFLALRNGLDMKRVSGNVSVLAHG
jgi:hypothetical protein